MEANESFMQAFLDCALWSSVNPEDNRPLDDDYGPEDIAAADVAKLKEECAAFLSNNSADIEASGLSVEAVATDLWLSRNRHGAGFFDNYPSGSPEYSACQRLQAAAKTWGEVNLLPRTGGGLYVV